MKVHSWFVLYFFRQVILAYSKKQEKGKYKYICDSLVPQTPSQTKLVLIVYCILHKILIPYSNTYLFLNPNGNIF